MPKKTVKIGGKVYDAESGALLKLSKPQLDIVPMRKASATAPSAKTQRSRLKRSTTLNREFVKAPTVTAKPAPQLIKKCATRPTFADKAHYEIGRASCRERV